MNIGLDWKLDHSVSKPSRVQDFSTAMLDWYKNNGRGYIWRGHSDPYKILVSEIMLQQTNADRVAPIYQRFAEQYPNIRVLAQAELPDLMTVLKPIGLSYRARRLKEVARKLVAEYDGELPAEEEALLALPGIGRYILCRSKVIT